MPSKHLEPKKSVLRQDTSEEELFRPDPQQKTLLINPKTGHVIAIPSKKRKREPDTPAPFPLKKNMATSPLTLPDSPPAAPAPHTSPTLSPRHPHTPPPQEDELGGVVDDEQLGDPDYPNIPTHDPWNDYYTPDVPQEEIYPSRPSPPDDNLGFTQLIHRAAQYHGVDLHTDPIDDNFLMDTFAPSQKPTSILPMLKGVTKHAPEILKEPVGARVVNPRLEKKSKPAPSNPVYIKGHLLLDSLVVSNAWKRATHRHQGMPHPLIKNQNCWTPLVKEWRLKQPIYGGSPTPKLCSLDMIWLTMMS